MTILEFLLARLDEREAALKRVPRPYRLYVCDDGHLSEPLSVDPWDDPPAPGARYQRGANGEDRLPNHHNTWERVFDPDRELRDVAAKRARLDWLAGMEHDNDGEDFPTYDGCRILAQPGELGDLEVGYCSCGVDSLRDRLYRIETLPFTEHSDYDESWRP